MAFIQRIQDGCEEHDECCVIDCITTETITDPSTSAVIHDTGAVVWHSHMHSAIHPEHRLNPSHLAEDHRGKAPVPVSATPYCDDCRTHPAAQGHFGLPEPASLSA